MDDLSGRLDRIDDKLDKLSDAIARLATIEERITHQTKYMSQQQAQITDLEKRLRAMEYLSSTRSVVIGYVERFGWLLVTALIGLAVYYFKLSK